MNIVSPQMETVLRLSALLHLTVTTQGSTVALTSYQTDSAVVVFSDQTDLVSLLRCLVSAKRQGNPLSERGTALLATLAGHTGSNEQMFTTLFEQHFSTALQAQ